MLLRINKMKVNSEWEDKREKRQGWKKIQLRTTNIYGNLRCWYIESESKTNLHIFILTENGLNNINIF